MTIELRPRFSAQLDDPLATKDERGTRLYYFLLHSPTSMEVKNTWSEDAQFLATHSVHPEEATPGNPLPVVYRDEE